MENIEHDDSQLEVEFTDLDPIDENSKLASVRLAAHSLFTKIHWQQVRSSVQRILLLSIVLLMPLMIGTSYSTAGIIAAAHECIRQQPKIVYVADVTITSAGTTLTEVAVTVPSTSTSKRLYHFQCL